MVVKENFSRDMAEMLGEDIETGDGQDGRQAPAAGSGAAAEAAPDLLRPGASFFALGSVLARTPD